MGEAEYQHNCVIDRCIIAIHDFATRPNTSRSRVMRQLKAEGFTAQEISEAARRMASEREDKTPC